MIDNEKDFYGQLTHLLITTGMFIVYPPFGLCSLALLVFWQLASALVFLNTRSHYAIWYRSLHAAYLLVLMVSIATCFLTGLGINQSMIAVPMLSPFVYVVLTAVRAFSDNVFRRRTGFLPNLEF